MLTSESNDLEFHRFIHTHEQELMDRFQSTVYNKYRKVLIHAAARKGNIPPVFVKLKVSDDIILCACGFGVKFQGRGVVVSGLCNYLIMKDLRNQTKIMVVETDDSVIVYRTHSISRYKERLGLDSDMDFEDVCKHMASVASCCSPKIIESLGQIHDTNPDHWAIRIICLKGAFIGYYSLETHVCYAETFLSSNEIRDNQAFLDVNRDPAWQKWKENQELILQGKIRCYEAEDPFVPGTAFGFETGNLNVLSDEEIKDRIDKYEKIREEIPDFDEQIINANIRKKENRLKRKGIK